MPAAAFSCNKVLWPSRVATRSRFNVTQISEFLKGGISRSMLFPIAFGIERSHTLGQPAGGGPC